MKLFKWFNVWLSYPMTTCVAFMCGTQHRLYAHVLRVGPLAFCILWKRPVIVRALETGKPVISSYNDDGEFEIKTKGA